MEYSITENTIISDIIKIRKDAKEIFAKHGLDCIDCFMNEEHTLLDASIIHGVDLDALLKDFNAK